MKKTLHLTIACVALLGTTLLAPQAAAGEGIMPEFTTEVSGFSQYVWRGMVLTDGPVMQPSGTVSWNGLYVNLWSSMDLDNVNGLQRKFNELDFSAGYERSMGRVSLSGGIIRYTFPNTDYLATTEVHAGAALDTILSPSVTAYFDVGEIDGAYVTMDAGHSIALPKLGDHTQWSLDLAAGIGWGSQSYNRGYFAVDQSGLVDFHPSLSAPICFDAGVCVTPSVSYSNLVDRRIRSTPTFHAHNFFGGVTVSYTP